MSKVTLKPDGTEYMGIQVYDDGKMVDIPEEEVKNTEDMMRVFTGIQEVWWAAYKQKISEPNFISGLLRFAISFVKRGLDQKPELKEKEQRILESVGTKITELASEAADSEDDRAAIAKFKKPYKQLSDTEKETLEEDLTDRHTLNAIVYCFIARAFDIWTPKFWRSDAIAAEIKEKDQDKTEKEKAETEKRVPVGNYQ
jgi:hypothetical protein